MSPDSVTIPVALAAGIISFASPCFLPIVPVFLTYLTGAKAPNKSIPALANAGMPDADGFIRKGRPADQVADKRAGRRSAAWMGVLNATVFVAAFSAVFMALWLSIAFVGASVGQYRGALRIAGGVVLILMGLLVFGFFSVPRKSGRGGPLSRIDGSREPTLRRSALMGLAFAAGWSPCIGPVLGMILGLAMVRGTAAAGSALLIAYCLGLGLPLILVAAGVGGLKDHMQWITRHHGLINKVTGVLLIASGFLLVTDLLAPLSNISIGGI